MTGLISLILVIAGLYSLLLFIRSFFRGKATTFAKRQKIYVAAGIVFLLLGIVLYFAPSTDDDNNTNSPPTILGVTVRKDQANGELVYQHEVNFYDRDGNTDMIERELIDLTDPSQRQYIDVKNGVIDVPPELQKIRATVKETWHCNGHVYVATIEVSLVDKDGNRSEPVRYRIDCS